MMYVPARLTGPRAIAHWAESVLADHGSAGQDGPLESLACSFGRLAAKLMSKTEQAGDASPRHIEAQTGPSLASRLRRVLQVLTSEPGTFDGSQDPRLGFVGTPRHPPSKPARELAVTQQREHVGVIFWQALDPIERDAFRAVADSRTFAAGARLMEEGGRAEYVIVILSGRTKICVQENGRERVVAERGPGQLVGERAALHISVRSASVIALETVQALVVRTWDFAAFISAHPAVLDIVESQLYDRLTEARYERDDAARAGGTHPAGRQVQHARSLNGENCTVILSDVVGFGGRWRTDEDRHIIREMLLDMTHAAMHGIPDVWSWDDRGDGLLTVIPPNVPTAKVVEQLHVELPPALEKHNRTHHESARIQLRVAANVGPVTSDTMGVSGEAIIVTARLVEAQPFKQMMDDTKANLGIIASTFIYETVIRHHPYLAGYTQVQVEVKESSIPGWMKLFGT